MKIEEEKEEFFNFFVCVCVNDVCECVRECVTQPFAGSKPG